MNSIPVLIGKWRVLNGKHDESFTGNNSEQTAIRQSTATLPLPTEDIMDLLNLCLTSTYFQYNG